jgi:hypothetical protein
MYPMINEPKSMKVKISNTMASEVKKADKENVHGNQHTTK